MAKDPENPFDDKALGLAALGTLFFCTATGLGVGAFVQEPVIGGVTGAVVGIAASIVVIPPLMRDWR